MAKHYKGKRHDETLQRKTTWLNIIKENDMTKQYKGKGILNITKEKDNTKHYKGKRHD